MIRYLSTSIVLICCVIALIGCDKQFDVNNIFKDKGEVSSNTDDLEEDEIIVPIIVPIKDKTFHDLVNNINFESTILLVNSSTTAVDIGDIHIVSAPILPKYLGFDDYSGPNYLFDKDNQDYIYQNGFLTFQQLYDACIDDEKFGFQLNKIKELGNKLTRDDAVLKYETLALCAYEKFAIKPYYVPQFLDDVDICHLLNTDKYHWRMITEEDLNDSNKNILLLLHSVYEPNKEQDDLASVYFSPLTFIKSNDGIKIGLLIPDISYENRIKKIIYQEDQNSYDTYEGVSGSHSLDLSDPSLHHAITLRCLRISSNEEPN